MKTTDYWVKIRDRAGQDYSFRKMVRDVQRDALESAARGLCTMCAQNVSFIVGRPDLHAPQRADNPMIRCPEHAIRALMPEGD